MKSRAWLLTGGGIGYLIDRVEEDEDGECVRELEEGEWRDE